MNWTSQSVDARVFAFVVFARIVTAPERAGGQTSSAVVEGSVTDTTCSANSSNSPRGKPASRTHSSSDEKARCSGSMSC